MSHPSEWSKVKTMFAISAPIWDHDAFEDYKKVRAILCRIEDEHLPAWRRYSNMLHRPGPPDVKEKRKRLEQEWGDYINGMLEKASKLQMMIALRQRK